MDIENQARQQVDHLLDAPPLRKITWSEGKGHTPVEVSVVGNKVVLMWPVDGTRAVREFADSDQAAEYAQRIPDHASWNTLNIDDWNPVNAVPH